ncbi:unnamed protein product [Moneuplotes crassus]|uniref:Uncharacterized protein n=1 Tax=Euplotes crassus TaxID=5936 RepID=A0AAD1Y3U4_EUPCR|nr:unnamed protein product [Moneuplotes crassus]
MIFALSSDRASNISICDSWTAVDRSCYWKILHSISWASCTNLQKSCSIGPNRVKVRKVLYLFKVIRLNSCHKPLIFHVMSACHINIRISIDYNCYNSRQGNISLLKALDSTIS